MGGDTRRSRNCASFTLTTISPRESVRGLPKFIESPSKIFGLSPLIGFPFFPFRKRIMTVDAVICVRAVCGTLSPIANMVATKKNNESFIAFSMKYPTSLQRVDFKGNVVVDGLSWHPLPDECFWLTLTYSLGTRSHVME